MAIIGLLAFFGVAALIVAGAVIASNTRQMLYNRRLMLEIHRRNIRRETGRKLVAVRERRKT